MISDEDLLEIINELRDENGLDPVGKIDDESRLIQDLGLDSLALAVLTVRIEAKTGVDVFADGIISTISELRGRIRGE